MLRGLRNPGAGPGDAAARDRHRTDRGGYFWRTGFNPSAAGLRPGDGPPRAFAQKHPRLHDARFRDQRSNAWASPPPYERGWMLRSRDRYPAQRHADAEEHRAPARER